MSDLAKRSGDLIALLERMRPAISQALPKHISAERIARIALTAVRANPALALCTPQSFLGSLLQASQLGLEVNTPLGQAYLIPYKDVCTLVIGYQGMLDLARRSGMVKAIYAYPVFEGDAFDYELGLEPQLKHKPTDKPGPLTHVYAVARLTDGEPIFTVLTRATVETFRARSRAKDNGPWVTDYTAMSLKTAVRRLFTWLPKSAEQATALAIEDSDHEQAHAQAFSPEVVGILDLLPEEPAPSPVPAGTPDGRRVGVVKLPEGRRSKGGANAGAAPPAAGPASSTPAPVPSGSAAPWATPPAPAEAPPAGPPPVDPAALLALLARVDESWKVGDAAAIIATWPEATRREAFAWAHALANNVGSIADQMRRPPCTNIDGPDEGAP
jgi:recombination protein RecT